MNAAQIAEVCHEANRAYCKAIGDNSQVEWGQAPNWQIKSAIDGVNFRLSNPTAPASAQHDSWLESKRKDGWQYGPIKDLTAKTHPCFVPYIELPIEQQKKDALFTAIVMALK